MQVTHTKTQIQALLIDPDYVNAAIKILGDNQTEDEKRTKNTRHHNGIGFSAAYGRVGIRFYEFVTGIQMSSGEKKWEPKSLANPIADKVFSRYVRNREDFKTALAYARYICTLHWKQLGVMLEAGFTVPTLSVTVPERPKQRDTPMSRLSGDIAGAKGKAYKAYVNGKKVWLPKSLVTVEPDTSEDNDGQSILVIPTWLARKKGLV
jgi:hypothetical protein